MSEIEWTDKTWNPVTGCTKISLGCWNCYAERMAKRLAGRAGYPKDNPFRVTLHKDRLYQPSTWRTQRRVFVCSMGDLFHEEIPGKFINDIWLQIINNKRHIFQILTKRPERMLEWTQMAARGKCWPIEDIWPDNVHLGVTAENQEMANKRIPILWQIPAVARFVSVEPMLGPVNLSEALPDWWESDGINWVICGGESGPGARPMHPEWVRSIRDQCNAAAVPFFFKGWGRVAEHDGTALQHVPLRHTGTDKEKLCFLDGKIWDQMPK